jgi:uncharacterized protein (TIGR03067 family)
MIRRLLFTLLVIGSVTSPAFSDEKETKKGLSDLIGTWTMLSMDSGNGPKELDGFKLVISKEKIIFQAPSGDTKKMGDIARVDSSAKPMEIDLTNDGETGFGIYELKDDALKLIVRNPGERRAKEFKANPKGMLFILKREKK